jgi:NADH-quinone oxidoreductase subunit G
MPRPEPKLVTFSIDGREVIAPENIMLVDGAKHGDVEIPVFCYEPKLGQPVGACRMCLVEIEGIPKLQTACSTPVKDGMVVHTQTDRVKQAQQAVVEFLLINHPLDCPVCDKGGECPLQDISFGWGGGRSRFIEPKRHFEKPLELSPLIAIDRERCILCYRCVRFSQEVSEDYQLVFQERGAHTFVGTFDGHPYVAPFSGNIIELCPVGALTSQPYRFRARPWDIEGAGGVCTLCPAQCNVTFTVRDERVLRVMARDHDEVDDGWLCDRGRFAYQAIHVDERITQPMVRDGGELRPVSWERALDEAAAGLRRAGGRVGVLAGGATTTEEGFLLQHIARAGLGTDDLDSRTFDASGRDELLALHDPALQATVPDLEFAHTVLTLGVEPVDDMPIVDLRIRKGVRRNRVKLAVATSRPSSLDPNARQVVRFAPGDEARAATLIAAALSGGEVPEQLAAVVALLRDGGEDVVIVYGERVLADPAGAAALVAIADALGLRGREGAGLLGVPSDANARGLREAGVLPFAGPGLAPVATAGRSTAEIAAAAADGELAALWLVDVDPLETHTGRATWDAGLERASTVVAHAGYLTAGVREHATVVFPAESHAEHEGTVVHPDGRVQRLRQAIARQGETRAGWWILAELAKRLGLDDVRVLTGAMASQQLFAAVPFYNGLTLDLIGGRGLRWPAAEDAAAAWPAATVSAPPVPEAGAQANGRLRLGTYRSVWAGPEVAYSPALQFLKARTRVELSPTDAKRLGVFDGEKVVVGDDHAEAVVATVSVRAAVPVGSAFLEGNGVDGPLVEIRKGALVPTLS